MTTYTATLPDGTTATKKSRRTVTHVVGVHWPERGFQVFRWSGAPESAIKELERRGWNRITEIEAVPVKAA
jgi:hypothetical protein